MNNLPVQIAFTLNVDPDEWEGRHRGMPSPTSDEDRARIASEVARHAEAVVRDLYFDQGWIAE